MNYKNISDLNLKVAITDYEDLLDDELENEYGWYEVLLNECMALKPKDTRNLVRSLKEYSYSKYTEDLCTERIKIFDKETHIGYVEIYLFDKIKSVPSFISLSEAKSGDAGVCACTIVNNGLFKSLVYNRRYAYIEWINLSDEYKSENNEGLVLKKILEFLRTNYKVKRVFSRPVAINLSSDEVKVMRVDYHQIELNYYLKYRNYMVGFVNSYYADAQSNRAYLSTISREEYSKVYDSYNKKRVAIQNIYKENGMRFIGNEFEGVMCAEF